MNTLLTLIMSLHVFVYANGPITNAKEAPLTLTVSGPSQWQIINKRYHTIDQNLAAISSTPNTQAEFEKIEQIWKELFLLHEELKFTYDQEKEKAESTTNNEDDQKALVEYEKAKTYSAQLFARASLKRAAAIKALTASKEFGILDWSSEHLSDIERELIVIPFNWVGMFELRYLKIKDDLSSGAKGWYKVFKELSLVLFLLLVAYLFHKYLNQFSQFLLRQKETLVRRSFREKSARVKLFWIQKTLPYLPWIAINIYLYSARALLRESYFTELQLLFPYVIYYSYYRIFRIFLNQMLTSYALFGGYLSVINDKPKLLSSNRSIGLFWLISIIILHTVKSTVGNGFVYLLVVEFAKYLFLLLLFYTANKWTKEIALINEKIFPEIVAKYFNILLQSRLSFIFALPLAFVTLVGLLVLRLYGYTERFEIVKSISAEIFRRKVEVSASKGNGNSSGVDIENYKTQFLSSEENQEQTLTKSQNQVLEQLNATIENWNNGHEDEHIAAIVGEFGIGKTSLLKQVTQTNLELNIIKINLNKKILKQQDFENEFQELIQLKTTDKKTLCVIDNAQNLFLSKVGGFDIFKAFLRLTQDNIENIFWVVSFNNYSWNYLQSVLNKTRYFNYVLNIEKWTEEEIRNHILYFHGKTNFDMTFDNVLLAAQSESQSGGINYVKDKFFRLLWEESLGNPIVAKNIWLKSIKNIIGKKIIIGLPKDQSEAITGLPDDFYFVLAGIVRHHNISAKELQEATDLSEDVIKNAIKTCTEKGYLIQNNGNYYLNAIWQHSVYSTLKRKNFIYGI